MQVRVQKIISNAGYCSRRKAEELIRQGLVKVNDKVINLGGKAEPGKDKITVNGREVKIEKRIYLLFNKPAGCITTLDDPLKRKTIFDVIKIKERIFPVGRLDKNTSGLLLLTNDGDFANKIMHPRYEIEKTYLVETDDPINNNQIKLLEKGVELEDGKTSPAKVKKKGNSIEITIHEGKKRIVRRMIGYVGLKVLSLKRIKVGKLSLGSLKEGKYRSLTEKEIKSI